MTKQTRNKPSSASYKPSYRLAVFMTIPFVLALPPILSWYIAQKLQAALQLGPWVVYLAVALGLASGFREFYRIIKTYGDPS